jgi:hypothetical protein
MRLAALAMALGGLLPVPLAAQDFSWTPCHQLETGGKLHEPCRACEERGSGWRFYVSRGGVQSQCRRDPHANPGNHRKPWEEDDKAVRQSIIQPVRPAVVPAPAVPRVRSEAENRREAERRRELKRSEP